MKKITDKQMAERYGVTYQTLGNYKKGPIEKQRLYKALKDNYDLPDFLSKDIKELNTEELFSLHEYISKQTLSNVDTLQIVNDFIHEKLNPTHTPDH